MTATDKEREDVTEALWSTLMKSDFEADQMVAFAMGMAVGTHLPEWLGHKVGTQKLDDSLHLLAITCVVKLMAMGYTNNDDSDHEPDFVN